MFGVRGSFLKFKNLRYHKVNKTKVKPYIRKFVLAKWCFKKVPYTFTTK